MIHLRLTTLASQADHSLCSHAPPRISTSRSTPRPLWSSIPPRACLQVVSGLQHEFVRATPRIDFTACGVRCATDVGSRTRVGTFCLPLISSLRHRLPQSLSLLVHQHWSDPPQCCCCSPVVFLHSSVRQPCDTTYSVHGPSRTPYRRPPSLLSASCAHWSDPPQCCCCSLVVFFPFLCSPTESVRHHLLCPWTVAHPLPPSAVPSFCLELPPLPRRPRTPLSSPGERFFVVARICVRARGAHHILFPSLHA
ncbi:hypothetical protein C8F04DRAFT_1304511, partial [Mycena alexandri]